MRKLARIVDSPQYFLFSSFVDKPLPTVVFFILDLLALLHFSQGTYTLRLLTSKDGKGIGMEGGVIGAWDVVKMRVLCLSDLFSFLCLTIYYYSILEEKNLLV